MIQAGPSERAGLVLWAGSLAWLVSHWQFEEKGAKCWGLGMVVTPALSMVLSGPHSRSSPTLPSATHMMPLVCLAAGSPAKLDSDLIFPF